MTPSPSRLFRNELPFVPLVAGLGLLVALLFAASILLGRAGLLLPDAGLFAAIHAELPAGSATYGGRLGAADKGNRDTAYRAIADHARCLTFCVADGAVVSPWHAEQRQMKEATAERKVS